MLQETTIKVLIVDHRDIITAGLRAILSQNRYIEVVGEASSVESALLYYQQHRPNIFIVNLTLPTSEELTMIHELSRINPQVRVLVTVCSFTRETIQAILNAGAVGIITMRSSSHEIIAALHSVWKGKTTLDSEITSVMLDSEDIYQEDLTQRELEILHWVAYGLSNNEIAERLGISQFTVKNHVSRLLAKLQVSSRTEAATLALRMGIVRLN